MTIDQIKKSLFTQDVVVAPPVVKGSKWISRLDTKVGDIALQVIGGAALTVAVAGVIGCSVFIGWSVIPIVITVAITGVGCTSFYVRSHFKRYHNDKLLKNYQVGAHALLRHLEYLDKFDFLKGQTSEQQRVIKQHLFKPVTALRGTHHSLETIFRHEILSPQQFKRAFDLEIKYLDLPEALALYEEVLKSGKQVPRYDLNAFTNAAAQKEWKGRLKTYLDEKNKNLFSAATSMNSDLIEDQFTSVDQAVNIINTYFNYGLLTQEKDLFDRTKGHQMKLHKEYPKFIHTQCPAIHEAQKDKNLCKQQSQNHPGQNIIMQAQSYVFQELEELQKDYDQKIHNIQEAYKEKLKAIALRAHTPRSPDEIDADLQQEAWLKRKQDDEEKDVERQSQDALDAYMEKGISNDLLETLEEVQESNKLFDKSCKKKFQTQLEGPINIFIRNKQAELLKYSAQFKVHYGVYIKIIDANPP